MKNRIYALYDDNDYILGVYNRQELKKLLGTTSRNFDCIISRINRGLTNRIKYQGQKYKVYIFRGE